MKVAIASMMRDRKNDFAIAFVLLVVLVGILLSPTIRTIRTIEADPKTTLLYPVELRRDEQVTDIITAENTEVSYVIAWVKDVHENDQLAASDYESLELQILDSNGNLIQTAPSPVFIKREDKPALLFTLTSPLVANEAFHTLTFVQRGDGVVRMLQPIADQVHEGEQVAVALQLGEKKNWIALLIDTVYEEPFDGKDIASYLHRGGQIAAGENPYSCITDEKVKCAGYPAHLPGMYYVAALAVKLGVGELSEWAQVWRPVVFAFWLAIGVTLLGYGLIQRKPALAVFSFGFWLLNRWSIDVLRIAHTDFIGAFFLLLAAMFAARMPLLAAFLLGVSLSVKQLALLVVPLFILFWWRVQKVTMKKMAALIGLIVVTPLVTTLPFLIDNPRATVIGITNVVTRPAQTVHGFAPSLDTWLDVTFVHRSIIMLVLIGMVYVAGWRKVMPLSAGVFLVLATMIGFTHVLYNQYIVWLLPFIPLVAMSVLRRRKHLSKDSPGKNE